MINSLNNNTWDKKRNKNKIDDNAKSEDKDNVREVVLDKDKSGAPSDSSSIDTHVSDATKTIVLSPQHVQDILTACPLDNLI